MPRYVYYIIVAFICGYLLGKFADDRSAPPDARAPVDSTVQDTRLPGAGSAPAVSGIDGGPAPGEVPAPQPAAGTIARRTCRVTAIVESHQDMHLLYCEGTGADARSLIAEVNREGPIALASLEPGELVDVVGRVADATTTTLWLENCRVEGRQ